MASCSYLIGIVQKKILADILTTAFPLSSYVRLSLLAIRFSKVYIQDHIKYTSGYEKLKLEEKRIM